MVDVPSFAPKIVERSEVFWLKGIVLGAIGDAEAGVAIFLIVGNVDFARIEEVVADASSSVLLEEDGVSEVKVGVDIEVAFKERLVGSGIFSAQGVAQRCANESCIVKDEDADRLFI